MNNYKYFGCLCLACFVFVSCKKDVLDRPPQTSYIDNSASYWRNEDDIRMYGNGFYTNYFNGFGLSFTWDYAPVMGYNFNDDVTGKNVQANFESNVPASRGSSSETATWQQQYSGPTWNFSWVRKANIFISRLDTVAKSRITDETYKHWTAVARFFRGYEYARLVSVFGNVPYYDKVLSETDTALYKDRDDRGLVMDKVYDDFKYVLSNMRTNDGAQFLNRYVAAAFISRFMLFEGSYQRYHNLDGTRAQKYLQFAIDAASIVMGNSAYKFSSDFKTLFSSDNLAGNQEVLMYRAYDASLQITHSIGSYSNGTEVDGVDPNLVLTKAFITTDGQPWQSSTVPAATSFAIADLIKTRDPRFEASFIDKVNGSSATLLYQFKFASRDAITYIGKTYPAAWGSSTNTSDAPVIRLAEVVLNWIEAKAILAQDYGGAPINQSDLDKSINAIRDRPIDAAAAAKGVQKTAHLLIAAIPNDPVRDADVAALIWEIRRERRMEFAFEGLRLLDLKRWNKLNYMDYSTNPDYFLGPWVNIPVEIPSALTTATKGIVKVKKADGTIVTWDGTNASAMVGFWVVQNAQNRLGFSDKNYLSPIGTQQINEYKSKGHTLTQTAGW